LSGRGAGGFGSEIVIHSRLDWVPAISVKANTAIKMRHRARGFFAGLALERMLFDLFVASLSLSGVVSPIEFMMVLMEHASCQTSGGDCRANLGAGPRSEGTSCL
jgi:hypothetical protein